MFEELKDLEIDNYINYIVTPITPYLICDHFISDEINLALRLLSIFISFGLVIKLT